MCFHLTLLALIQKKNEILKGFILSVCTINPSLCDKYNRKKKYDLKGLFSDKDVWCSVAQHMEWKLLEYFLPPWEKQLLFQVFIALCFISL